MFPRDAGRFQGIGQVVDIEDGHALEGSDLIQIIVVGDDFGIDLAAQADKLGIDALDVIEIIVDDADFDVIIFLHLLQDIQAAAALIALQQIRRIGDELQFFQDEDRHQQGPFEEARTADFGDTAVDDGTRIEELAGKVHILALAAVLLSGLAQAQVADQGDDFALLAGGNAHAGIAEDDAEDNRAIGPDDRQTGERQAN